MDPPAALPAKMEGIESIPPSSAPLAASTSTVPSGGEVRKRGRPRKAETSTQPRVQGTFAKRPRSPSGFEDDKKFIKDPKKPANKRQIKVRADFDPFLPSSSLPFPLVFFGSTDNVIFLPFLYRANPSSSPLLTSLSSHQRCRQQPLNLFYLLPPLPLPPTQTNTSLASPVNQRSPPTSSSRMLPSVNPLPPLAQATPMALDPSLPTAPDFFPAMTLPFLISQRTLSPSNPPVRELPSSTLRLSRHSGRGCRLRGQGRGRSG
jgi:hypothetical protein